MIRVFETTDRTFMSNGDAMIPSPQGEGTHKENNGD